MSDDWGNTLSNYETTAHKILGGNDATGGYADDVPMIYHMECMGTPISIERTCVGFAVLLVCTIIAVISKVDGEYSLRSFVALVVGLAGPFAIWLYGSKAKREKAHLEEENKKIKWLEAHKTNFVCKTCGHTIYIYENSSYPYICYGCSSVKSEQDILEKKTK